MVNQSADAPNSRQLQTKHLTSNRKALRKSCQVGLIRVLAIRVGLSLVLNQNGIRNKMTWRNLVKQNMPDGTAEAFFFQAEDGIRDLTVTGVQTCALPI